MINFKTDNSPSNPTQSAACLRVLFGLYLALSGLEWGWTILACLLAIGWRTKWVSLLLIGLLCWQARFDWPLVWQQWPLLSSLLLIFLSQTHHQYSIDRALSPKAPESSDLLLYGAMLLHIGIWLAMVLSDHFASSLFWIVSTYLLPGSFWDFLQRKLHNSLRLHIYYDQDCRFCRKIALIFNELLLFRQGSVQTCQQSEFAKPIFERENSWVVTDAKHRFYYTKLEGVLFVFTRNPLFRLFIVFMPAMGLLNGIYHWIANNRKVLGKITQVLLPYRQL